MPRNQIVEDLDCFVGTVEIDSKRGPWLLPRLLYSVAQCFRRQLGLWHHDSKAMPVEQRCTVRLLVLFGTGEWAQDSSATRQQDVGPGVVTGLRDRQLSTG